MTGWDWITMAVPLAFGFLFAYVLVKISRKERP